MQWCVGMSTSSTFDDGFTICDGDISLPHPYANFSWGLTASPSQCLLQFGYTFSLCKGFTQRSPFTVFQQTTMPSAGSVQFSVPAGARGVVVTGDCIVKPNKDTSFCFQDYL